jgi:hypothetical protein
LLCGGLLGLQLLGGGRPLPLLVLVGVRPLLLQLLVGGGRPMPLLVGARLLLLLLQWPADVEILVVLVPPLLLLMMLLLVLRHLVGSRLLFVVQACARPHLGVLVLLVLVRRVQ